MQASRAYGSSDHSWTRDRRPAQHRAQYSAETSTGGFLPGRLRGVRWLGRYGRHLKKEEVAGKRIFGQHRFFLVRMTVWELALLALATLLALSAHRPQWQRLSPFFTAGYFSKKASERLSQAGT